MSNTTLGTVVVLHPEGEAATAHERVSRIDMAARLARLKDYRLCDNYDPAAPPEGALYFVPADTLLESDAVRLGIHSIDNLFGGVVGNAVAATKCITHPLVDSDALAPPGWCASFAEAVREVVLPGFSAFDRAAAERAGAQLLQAGPLRLKPGAGVGGNGQLVVRDQTALIAALDALEPALLEEHGLVLELNLDRPVTFSVGQVTLGVLRISYVGTQATVTHPGGGTVYGGSELLVQRGEFADLLATLTDPLQRDAVERALLYDSAAAAELDGFFASRRNYDVVSGTDAQGQFRCGVLEQSWRIGGASPAEIAALVAFAAEPELQQVHAETCERYGQTPVPARVRVHFDGDDGFGNRLIKYSRVWRDVDSA